MCSSIGDRTPTPYFWLRTIEHRTLNLIGPSLDLVNRLSNSIEQRFSNIEQTRTCSSFGNRTRTPYFQLQMHEHPNLNLTDLFTQFTKLLMELTQTSFFRTLNKLERVHLLVIALEHPILGFVQSNIELRTYVVQPSLVVLIDEEIFDEKVG